MTDHSNQMTSASAMELCATLIANGWTLTMIELEGEAFVIAQHNSARTRVGVGKCLSEAIATLNQDREKVT